MNKNGIVRSMWSAAVYIGVAAAAIGLSTHGVSAWSGYSGWTAADSVSKSEPNNACTGTAYDMWSWFPPGQLNSFHQSSTGFGYSTAQGFPGVNNSVVQVTDFVSDAYSATTSAPGDLAVIQVGCDSTGI